ncbi:MAG: nucleotide pyrophosphohydrolase [bacterium]|nr:MAG: nucleotide pyrophosphohydrolase [bacterium]
MNFEIVAARLREFAALRDWEQFHSPKNLASALIVEAAELLEIFQWMKQNESRSPDGATLEKVKEEIADIQIYLVRIADVLCIDISSAVEDKINQNAKKYPVEKSRGSAKKYNQL